MYSGKLNLDVVPEEVVHAVDRSLKRFVNQPDSKGTQGLGLCFKANQLTLKAVITFSKPEAYFRPVYKSHTVQPKILNNNNFIEHRSCQFLSGKN